MIKLKSVNKYSGGINLKKIFMMSLLLMTLFLCLGVTYAEAELSVYVDYEPVETELLVLMEEELPADGR